MKKSLIELNIQLGSLTIFRSLLRSPIMIKFRALLRALEEKNLAEQVSAYSSFVSGLYEQTTDISQWVRSFLLTEENFYIRKKAAGETIPPVMESCLTQELKILENLSRVSSAKIKSIIGYNGFLPNWETSRIDFLYDYQERIHMLPYTGYGIFARYSTFTVSGDKLVPVKYPDAQKLDELFGYERERNLILKNTEALLSGEGASNMLLYGDAGTGKSSTIKAVANHFSSKGLRLVEVRKKQLHLIPSVVEELSASPLKFILFIDDLSFSSNDDNFSALKAILEGSVSTCGKNIAIYATSNRRHLVKETMGDRTGDELHINDTLQETMSLASRFGLTITYQRPEKEEYLDIVKNLASQYGLDLSEEELFKKAEAHAIRCHGRSPRVAKQFVELQKIGI